MGSRRSGKLINLGGSKSNTFDSGLICHVLRTGIFKLGIRHQYQIPVDSPGGSASKEDTTASGLPAEYYLSLRSGGQMTCSSGKNSGWTWNQTLLCRSLRCYSNLGIRTTFLSSTSTDPDRISERLLFRHVEANRVRDTVVMQISSH